MLRLKQTLKLNYKIEGNVFKINMLQLKIHYTQKGTSVGYSFFDLFLFGYAAGNFIAAILLGILERKPVHIAHRDFLQELR